MGAACPPPGIRTASLEPSWVSRRSRLLGTEKDDDPSDDRHREERVSDAREGILAVDRSTAEIDQRVSGEGERRYRSDEADPTRCPRRQCDQQQAGRNTPAANDASPPGRSVGFSTLVSPRASNANPAAASRFPTEACCTARRTEARTGKRSLLVRAPGRIRTKGAHPNQRRLCGECNLSLG